MRPAVVCGIVPRDASVSYWPIISCPFKQSQKSLQKLTLVAKVANKGDSPRFCSSP